MSLTCPRCGYENEDNVDFCQECEFALAEAPLLVHRRYRMSKPYVFSSFRAVYEAEDVQENNRVYSVREFLPHAVSTAEKLTVRSNFESLMNRYMELKHKNLAGIANFFVEGNYYYVVYEFVNGLDITKYMSSHKILTGKGYPEKLVSYWTLQMCDLFEYLHHEQDSPIYLIDFKPHAVVFRQEDEQLVFIDLGLSRILSLLGPHYLITEDFQAFRKSGGKFDNVEWDLFCLGNFMYYLLTGVDLLRAPENVYMPLRVARPDISEAMIDIVTKAVGKNYRSHYKDVRDIRKDLFERVSPLPLRAFDFYQDFVGEKARYQKTQWPMFLANKSRTGSVGFPPRIPVKLKWSCKTKPSDEFYLTASEEYVYATSREGMVCSIHSRTGQMDWKSYISRNIPTPGIAYNGVLYYVTPNRELLSIEHSSNDFKWKLEMESASMASPIIYDDILFVTLYNGNIHAVNIEEGKILATFSIEGNIISSPIIHQNILYVASLNKMMCAIDVDTDEVIWQYESETGFSASPTMCRDIILAGSHDGTLCAVNAQNGRPMWTRNFKGAITQAIRATPDMIYFVTRSGKMLALDPERGQTIWQKDLGDSNFEYPFCLGTNMIFLVDSHRRLRTIDSFSGVDRHQLKMSHPAVSPLIIAHQQIYLVSSTGHVVAFGK